MEDRRDVPGLIFQRFSWAFHCRYWLCSCGLVDIPCCKDSFRVVTLKLATSGPSPLAMST